MINHKYHLVMQAQLIKRFYSSLLLVSVLCPAERGHAVEANRYAGWRRFLEDLCWFCDTKKGGNTVVTIAVEQSAEDRLIFWLASNEGSPKRTSVKANQATKYLSWLLDEMKKIHASPDPDFQALERRILEEAVKISYEKVNNYVSRLRRLIDQLGSENYQTENTVRGT